MYGVPCLPKLSIRTFQIGGSFDPVPQVPEPPRSNQKGISVSIPGSGTLRRNAPTPVAFILVVFPSRPRAIAAYYIYRSKADYIP